MGNKARREAGLRLEKLRQVRIRFCVLFAALQFVPLPCCGLPSLSADVLGERPRSGEAAQVGCNVRSCSRQRSHLVATRLGAGACPRLCRPPDRVHGRC